MRAHRLVVALATAGLVVACTDGNAPSAITDNQLAADLASSSADAVAIDLTYLVDDEAFSGLSAPAMGAPSAQAVADSTGLTVSRTRTCFDADGNPQSECNGTTTASVHLTLQLDGIRSREGFTAIVHRTRDHTISGLEGEETSRTHNGFGTSNDTTQFTREAGTRTAIESSSDSIINLVFNLPHASNPWPVSGQIIRNLDATITFEGFKNETRTISRRVVVTFPADSQGNVPIQVGSMTCNLNLVTHRVTNCQAS